MDGQTDHRELGTIGLIFIAVLLFVAFLPLATSGTTHHVGYEPTSLKATGYVEAIFANGSTTIIRMTDEGPGYKPIFTSHGVVTGIHQSYSVVSGTSPLPARGDRVSLNLACNWSSLLGADPNSTCTLNGWTKDDKTYVDLP